MSREVDERYLKAMFNSSRLPTIDFGLEDISRQAQKVAGKLSISGVQPKLSLKLRRKENTLISVDEGGEYILKPQTPTFANMPENEQCCMDIAEELNIDVPFHCLLLLRDRSPAYLVKRFDREKKRKIHQEDFAQILEETDKYGGSVERIGKKLKEMSSAPGYDVQLLFERIVLNFVIGNGDAHLKNYSVSYKENDARLAPAYDIVCSKLVIPGEDDSAITIGGKKNNLKRTDFDKLADHLNIPAKVRYERFEKKFGAMKRIIEGSRLDDKKKFRFLEIVKERTDRLGLAE
jgi:serine/threonine-protein kinase HipA